MKCRRVSWLAPAALALLGLAAPRPAATVTIEQAIQTHERLAAGFEQSRQYDLAEVEYESARGLLARAQQAEFSRLQPGANNPGYMAAVQQLDQRFQAAARNPHLSQQQRVQAFTQLSRQRSALMKRFHVVATAPGPAATARMDNLRLLEADLEDRMAGVLARTGNAAQGSMDRKMATAERASVYQSRGDWPHAIAQYQQMLSINPKDTFARLQLANVYRSKGDMKDAAAQYRAYIQAQPNDPSGHAMLAQLYQQQRQWGPAIAEARATVSIDRQLVSHPPRGMGQTPGYKAAEQRQLAWAMRNLSGLLAQGGKPAESRQVLHEANVLDPSGAVVVARPPSRAVSGHARPPVPHRPSAKPGKK